MRSALHVCHRAVCVCVVHLLLLGQSHRATVSFNDGTSSFYLTLGSCICIFFYFSCVLQQEMSFKRRIDMKFSSLCRLKLLNPGCCFNFSPVNDRLVFKGKGGSHTDGPNEWPDQRLMTPGCLFALSCWQFVSGRGLFSQETVR